ncbi:MAG: (2Fe-2S) ferredoxin domain-containing protein [Bacteroidales bacterium]|jgi:NADH:ubiquinone oxidoreductase subunit E|nr:(2Fe-2S) ferredoxin domain-containing protein [Bacteroidales bacterium]MEE0961271.1 (2Fe-2S) ferredoxin domain-containing protein [Bacteroidales bacterium]MEE0976631.1 (2Fe-2S) ferredoxin domain-containing protein [Bacteroidales bacterium]MEE0983121.1 (2Fe-2S) ferredoxin domain-containing protein [Bacteroidales bacterium]MEE0991678.1 (2Fe-2S) ferredoxin domain-containing protein [Bacteroidales bacterium]
MEEKREIVICLGSSCFARGNNKNLEFIQEYLKVNNLKAKITFKGQLCSQQCSKGPVVIIDGEMYTDVNKTKLMEILNTKFGL